MKKTALAIATFAALSGSAIAADLPRRAPAVAPAPLPVASWSGCYLTGGVGYGMWNQDNHRVAPGVIEFEHTDGGRGWLGRVGGGCDYQLAQKWVIGVLADYDFASLKGDMTIPSLNQTGEEKNNWSWAAGGRVGYLPWDTLLVFVSGGYTQANFKGVNFITAAGAPIVPPLSIDQNRYTGWFLGSGYEYRFDWLPGLYWKTEYRFSSFSSKDSQLLQGGIPVTGEFVHSEKFIQTVTSSLVWRFNWWR
jgi:outer membrane immunogenic protein